MWNFELINSNNYHLVPPHFPKSQSTMCRAFSQIEICYHVGNKIFGETTIKNENDKQKVKNAGLRNLSLSKDS